MDILKLPNVTLVCVATKQHDLARYALIQSCNNIEFGAVKLITDLPDTGRFSIDEIAIEPFDTIDDWNKFIFYDLADYIDTEYTLLIHPDGYVVNPQSWQPGFLDYDYIGAPWYAGKQYDIEGNEVRVGNSVSIRSKKLLELPGKLGIEWTPEAEDTALCVTYRHLFEQEGITYAPLELACRFSKENNVPEQVGIEDTFCFHKRRVYSFVPETTYISYINLDSRPDRNARMIGELNRIGVQAGRTRGLLPEEVMSYIPDHQTYVMHQRTPGAIGCHYSQVSIMEEALRQGKHAWVMEDDLIFCDDFQDRLKHIELFLTDHEWDIMWLGGTYHKEPTWHKSTDGKHSHPDLQMCTCDLNKDWEPTEDPLMVRTYGAWSTYAYIVNKDRLQHILDILDQNVYRSMGIDWLFILQQPNLHTYAFNPGCVRQYNNQSNIGSGITDFDSFNTLGPHWFKTTL